MARLLRFWPYLRSQRHAFVVIFAGTLAVALFSALQPWPLKWIIDHLLGNEPWSGVPAVAVHWLGPQPGPVVVLTCLVAVQVVLYLGTALVDGGLAWLWTRSGRRMVNHLSEDLLAHLQRQSLVHHHRTSLGDILSRVTGDSWSVYRWVDGLIFTPLHAVLLTLLMIGWMWPLNQRLTFLACAAAPVVVLASMAVGRPLRRAARERREVDSALHAHVHQTLSGLPVVQSFTREEHHQARFESFARSAIRAQQRGTLLGSLNQLGSGFLATGATALILWQGALEVREGRLTVGGLLVFLAYLGSLQVQVRSFAGLYSTWQSTRAGLDRVAEILDHPPEICDPPDAIPLTTVRGRIELEQVTFGYRPGQPVLQDLSLAVEPDQTVAILGPTGAGKTTLVSLVARFADPWSGTVRVDGTDVKRVTLASLRRHVSILHQDAYLWPRSVADNIACGRPGATRSEIQAAAEAACAHEFIQRLPAGYDTVLGDRGATLSGGERQRLAMARAFLKDAPILILDEPTSALDPGTEQAVLEALRRLMKGRTTLLIAHRLSTVREADRILVLDQGRILEQGDHAGLMAAGGTYARWHRLQAISGHAPDTLQPAC